MDEYIIKLLKMRSGISASLLASYAGVEKWMMKEWCEELAKQGKIKATKDNNGITLYSLN